MAKICSAGVFVPPPESSAQDPPPWIGLKVSLIYCGAKCKVRMSGIFQHLEPNNKTFSPHIGWVGVKIRWHNIFLSFDIYVYEYILDL